MLILVRKQSNLLLLLTTNKITTKILKPGL